MVASANFCTAELLTVSPLIGAPAAFVTATLNSAAARVPTRQLPNWLVRIAALRDPAVKQIVPELGKAKNATSEKAQRVLGWSPRSAEEAIVATAESLVRLKLLSK